MTTNTSNFDAQCTDIGGNSFENESSVFLRQLAITTGVFGSSIVVISFTYFLANRENYSRSRKRNLFFLGCFVLGTLLFLFNSSYSAYIGHINYDCRLLSILFYIQGTLLVESCLFRLFSLHWRVKFNKLLITEAYSYLLGVNSNTDSIAALSNAQNFTTETSVEYYEDTLRSDLLYDDDQNLPQQHVLTCFSCMKVAVLTCLGVKTHPSEFQKYKFLASNKTASSLYVFTILVGFPIFLFFVYSDFPFRNGSCFGCFPTMGGFNQYLLILLNAIYILGVLYAFYILRKTPDSLGIKQELIVLGVFYLIFQIGVFSILRQLFSDIELQGKFSWLFIGAYMLLIMNVYLFPYQIYQAKREDQTISIASFENILATKAGSKSFTLFTVTSLSLESFLFYLDTKAWKQRFASKTHQQNKRTAQVLFNKYLTRNAFLQINVSHRCYTVTQNALLSDPIQLTTFDSAIAEMKRLICTDILPKYRESPYYKAFRNECSVNP